MKFLSPARQRKLMAFVSLILALIILGAKFYAYKKTDSLAVLSDALESIVNVMGATLLIVAIRFANDPPDTEHPYGHGKLEYLVAIVEGGAIAFAGLYLIIEAFDRFLDSRELFDLNFGLMVVLIAGLLNGGYGYYLKYWGEKFNSNAFLASGTHLISDFVTSLALLLGILLIKITGLNWIDSACALVAGFFLIHEGIKVFRHSLRPLIDAHNPKLLGDLARAFNEIRSPGVIQIHHTRVIESGREHHIDLHMVVPEFWTVQQIHDFEIDFQEKLWQHYPVNVECQFHFDPCQQVYCKNCDLPDCPIRQHAFEKYLPIQRKHLESPVEPRHKKG